jgi:hypothetical protein
MSRDKIGVQMGQKYMFDFEFMFRCKRDVLIRITLRVNNHRRPRIFVPN